MVRKADSQSKINKKEFILLFFVFIFVLVFFIVYSFFIYSTDICSLKQGIVNFKGAYFGLIYTKNKYFFNIDAENCVIKAYSYSLPPEYIRGYCYLDNNLCYFFYYFD